MIPCQALQVDELGQVHLCSGKAVYHVRYGIRAYPICSAHEVLWTFGRGLRVMGGQITGLGVVPVLYLVPKFPAAYPQDPDIERPIPSA